MKMIVAISPDGAAVIQMGKYIYALKYNLQVNKFKKCLILPNRFKRELHFLRIASTCADQFIGLSTITPSNYSFSDSWIN